MATRKTIITWIFFIAFLVIIFGYFSYHLHQPLIIHNNIPWDRTEVATKPVPVDHPKTVRILSLSGGGIRGIITAHVLRHLERITGKPISKLFDFVVCTSTGCLIAAQLLIPDQKGHPKFTADQVLKNYEAQSQAAFYDPWYRKILSFKGLIAPEYSNRSKARLIKKDVGETTLLSQLLLPTLITTYSLDRRAPRLFFSDSEEADYYYLWAILSAATSAPGFYAPVIVEASDQKTSDALADGATFAPSPSNVALAEAFYHFPHADKYVIVSVGTGHHVPEIAERAAVHWGKLQWGPTLFLAIHNAQSVNAERILSAIDKSAVMGERLEYYHFDLPIPTKTSHLDDLSPANIKRLNYYGEKLVRDNRAQLDHLGKELTQLSEQTAAIKKNAMINVATRLRKGSVTNPKNAQ